MRDIEDMSVTCTIFNFGNFPKRLQGEGRHLKDYSVILATYFYGMN